MSGLSATSGVFVPGQFSSFFRPTQSVQPVVQPVVQPTVQPAQSLPTQLETQAVPTQPAQTAQTQSIQPEDDWEDVKVDENENGDVDVEGDDDDEGETRKEKKKRLQAEAEAEMVAKDDSREHINLVFIGHVDAGKSTLCGQILFSTGMVDQRTIEKYEKIAKEKNRSTWFLAFIMDVDDEERIKGITVEVGRAYFNTDNKRYTILDAPGHKHYVPNMITGVSQADIGVLVISARRGEFEAGFDRSGQTREHALLAKTLGIKKLVVVINKMDEGTVMWEKERYDAIQNKLGTYLKQIGYNIKDDVSWIPISGFSGSNVVTKVDSSICPWYHGEALLPLLDSLKPLDRQDEKPLRIPVLDRYKESGKLHVLGKVECGVLRTGDVISAHPGGTTFKVLQIQNDENVITVAKPGENVKVLVKGTEVEEDSVLRGGIITPPNHPSSSTQDLVCQLVIIQLLESKHLFTAGYECVMHIHTAVEEVNVVMLLEQLDPKTGKTLQKLPKFVKEKAVVIVHFASSRPVCVEKFEDYPQLGRFSLRDEGKTIAFGKILALNAPVRRKK
eukprot:TRINITY_DN2175_c0_g2_i1.p1 TRINITY_DN2175_c0_g2~~TRINITY_DN2175_c0_g2_i1.p1  ORF type:complete len:601 (-),score=148.78 TRINITY_DN2175_c0_g2_i1:61-1737(-)